MGVFLAVEGRSMVTVKRRERIGGGNQEELDILKDIIKSNPQLHEKVLNRIRQLRLQRGQSLGDYLREKESSGISDRLDAKKRNDSK